ncbi:single-pass membrane and coiled-coil domain-containing protein 3-like [Ambystoma mexicanum]|uniref:single-pass membrane and coiled-coil domain-containing protein 3-like n=1 Tax=Ambystoma mexicanum TaxID=8296 RepID=UPI0037E9308A
MSFCDQLYPGNPRRRARAEQLYEQLRQHMLPNIVTANKVLRVLTSYLHRQLQMASMSRDPSLVENAVGLFSCLETFTHGMQRLDLRLKENLPANIYWKLGGSWAPRTAEALLKYSNVSKALWLVTAVVIVVTVATVFRYTTDNIQQPWAGLLVLATIVVWTTMCVYIRYGIDLVISRLLGCMEKSRLESLIQQYERELEDMREAMRERL